MKKEDVKIASVYGIKFGKNTVMVRIMNQHPHGGWVAANIATGKSMHITSADRLFRHNPKPAKEPPTSAQVATETDKPTADTTSNTDIKPAKAGGLNAAVRVLQEAGMPLRCKDIVKWMLQKGYWQTEGKTPEATISSAITREIKEKGTASRFRKSDRGMFTINS